MAFNFIKLNLSLWDFLRTHRNPKYVRLERVFNHVSNWKANSLMTGWKPSTDMSACLFIYCWTWMMMIQESYLGAGSEVGVFPWLQESSAESGQLGLKHGHSASGRAHEFICRLQSRTQSALSLSRVCEHPRQSVQEVLHQLRAHAQTHW